MKKVVSLLLSLSMVLSSCLSLNCFAEGPNEPTEQTVSNMDFNSKNTILDINIGGFVAGGATLGALIGAIGGGLAGFEVGKSAGIGVLVGSAFAAALSAFIVAKTVSRAD